MADPEPAFPEPEPADNAAFVAAIREGIEAADSGRVVPYEAIRRWLLSWGTSDEPPPRRG
jgi:predicted transcriptional regulator